ncbi:hypothetical protein TELCIR_20182, partial [Teladorsagia circumcincta]
LYEVVKERGTGWLVIAATLDFLTYAVCAPYSETTAGEQFDQILKLVAARGQSFYRLFQCPSMTIVKGAGMVMRAIIEESDVETSKSMQMLALTEGAFLTHLRMALLTTGKDLEILLISKLVLNKDNVRELIGSSLLPILVDLAVLAHLHVQRAKIQNQTNVIEASADQLTEGNSAEWYYATSDNNKERLGPFSFEKVGVLVYEPLR